MAVDKRSAIVPNDLWNSELADDVVVNELATLASVGRQRVIASTNLV